MLSFLAPNAQLTVYTLWHRGLGGSGKACFLLAMRLKLPVQLRVTGTCDSRGLSMKGIWTSL